MKKLIFKKFIKDISLFFLISITCVATIVWIIQAVNYLDLMSEDGHSLKVYFSYTLFSLPKIISKILPFIFMISLFYVIINYELNNELIIYWINGITKLNFINIIIIVSFLYCLLQIILTTIVVPYSLDKGRSYFRSSNVDLFTSIIKEKKFIDTVEDLTIFVEKKNKNYLENIIIKEKISNTQSQIIIAQNGEIVNNNGTSKKIVLINGKIINTEDNNQNIIDFSKFNLDLSKFGTSTVTHPKTQEMSTKNLIRCIKNIKDTEKFDKTIKNKNFFVGCNIQITTSILEEFLKRFVTPFFIILIGISSSLIITSSKDQNNYKLNNLFKFILGIFFIILSEIIMIYSGLDTHNVKFYFFIPLIFFLIIYFYLFLNYKIFRKS
jgi:lipopolysaccharide export system permease protein